jgi:TetR/AcrR family transcriptional regulator, transcriptional repressor for nem operon
VSAETRTGRPRKFDAEQVVDTAMRMFWTRGFRSTSMEDLAEATGVLPGSLHGAFGGKRPLFRAALLRYQQDAHQRVREVLDDAGSPRERIRRYLDRQVDLACGSGDQHGCLMAKTALELTPADESVTPIVRENFAALRAALADAVRQGQEIGEFARRWEPDVAAGMVLAVVEGFQVLGRCDGPEVLRRIAESTLAALA